MADHTQPLAQFDARLERVLGAFGDTAVRPFDAAALAEASILLDRRRQARRPWTLLAAAAVVSLLALLAIAVVSGGGRSVLDWLGIAPSPTEVEPTITFEIGPGNPQGRWMGSPRTIGAFEPSAGTYLAIDAARLCVGGRSYSQACSVVLSAASVPEAGQLRLTAQVGGQGCTPGDVGTYRFQLSPGGRLLTIEGIQDPCGNRAEGVVGTWYRSDCTNVTDDCLGLLEPGRYSSQFLHLKGQTGVYPASDFGAVEYSVPEGWANSGDWPMLLSLTRAGDYATEDGNGAAPGAYNELDLFAHPIVAAQTTSCDGTPQGFITNPTAAQAAAWLENLAAFKVTPRGATGISGLPAVAMDIQLAPGYAHVCPGETEPSADYLVLRDDTGRGFTPRVRGAEIHRLILVDLGAGELLAVVIDSSDPARFDDLVTASMEIVNSLVIR